MFHHTSLGPKCLWFNNRQSDRKYVSDLPVQIVQVTIVHFANIIATNSKLAMSMIKVWDDKFTDQADISLSIGKCICFT